MNEPTSAAPETATPTVEEFKERFPGIEPAEDTQGAEPPIKRLHPCADGKTRDDEQYEAYNKYNERLELKKAQFKKDPDQFVHMDDIIMGVIRGDKGDGCYFGRFSLTDAKCAMVTLQYRFYNALTEMDYAQEMKKMKEQGLLDANGRPISKKAPGIIA